MNRSHRGRPRIRRYVAATALAAVALGGLAGCGSGGTQAAPAPSVTMAGGGGDSMSMSTPTVHIGSFAYMAPASVSPGSQVSVMNMDGEAHTVTSDTGVFDVKAPAGMTVTFKAPMTPGSYPFHCTYHSNMHGVLIVK